MTMSDYASLLGRLRTHFASAANNENILRRLRYEEAMASRRMGEKIHHLEVAKILLEHVPDLKPHVLYVAMIARHSTGMMGENLASLSIEERNLYMLCRQSMMSPLAALQNPEVAQILLAAHIANLDNLMDTLATPPAYETLIQSQKLLMHIGMMAELLNLKAGASHAPALEKTFLDKHRKAQASFQPDTYFSRGNKGPHR